MRESNGLGSSHGSQIAGVHLIKKLPDKDIPSVSKEAHRVGEYLDRKLLKKEVQCNVVVRCGVVRCDCTFRSWSPADDPSLAHRTDKHQKKCARTRERVDPLVLRTQDRVLED